MIDQPGCDGRHMKIWFGAIAWISAWLLVAACDTCLAQPADSLPSIVGEDAPSNFDAMWRGFDPRSEPLETEVLHEWEEDGVVLRVVRFRIGVFKGQVAKLAAVYGYPKGQSNLPGLLQIHGGGQYADHKACVANAKRGYATVSIAWAGRISATNYRVSPDEVKLFWDNAVEDPNYRPTTDWGAVDGYHAPSRNPGNQFPKIDAAKWTLDEVESPRNSGWFLCAVAARRALTFLEHQPEVDSKRLGVYGHSMGGKLTVLTAVDSRVKAAAPSCGGISDRYNDSDLFCKTLGDDVSLKRIACPIIFLSPANDFHGRMGDLPKALQEIASDDWRVTCSPHHNHQDTPKYEAATLLWFDQHLKQSFEFPETPDLDVQLGAANGDSIFTVDVDGSLPVESVDFYYTQNGKPNETPADRDDVVHRFWHHTPASQTSNVWTGRFSVADTNRSLWCYANVTYRLPKTVEGVGYYYRAYQTERLNLSSVLQVLEPAELQHAAVQANLRPTRMIEDFQGDWEKEWFTYRPEEWARSTNKPSSIVYMAPNDAKLVLEVRSALPNDFVVMIDDHAASVQLTGDNRWQTFTLKASEFQDAGGEPLKSFLGVRQIRLSAKERLRTGRKDQQTSRIVGGTWKGKPPEFRLLKWLVPGGATP